MSTPPPIANPSRAPRRGPRNIDPASLLAYSLPLPAKVSILHRASGALMFLGLPVLLWVLDLSLRSDRSWEELRSLASGTLPRLVLLALAWSLLHHTCAGIRFLLIDLEIGVSLLGARRGAWAVLAASLALTLLLALWMFGVLP